MEKKGDATKEERRYQKGKRDPDSPKTSLSGHLPEVHMKEDRYSPSTFFLNFQTNPVILKERGKEPRRIKEDPCQEGGGSPDHSAGSGQPELLLRIAWFPLLNEQSHTVYLILCDHRGDGSCRKGCSDGPASSFEPLTFVPESRDQRFDGRERHSPARNSPACPILTVVPGPCRTRPRPG